MWYHTSVAEPEPVGAGTVSFLVRAGAVSGASVRREEKTWFSSVVIFSLFYEEEQEPKPGPKGESTWSRSRSKGGRLRNTV